MSPTVTVTAADKAGNKTLASLLYSVTGEAFVLGQSDPAKVSTGCTMQGLTTVTSDTTYNTKGVVSNMDFQCYVTDNVGMTFNNCLFRGRPSTSQVKPALVNFGTQANRGLLNFCTIRPDQPAEFISCVAGYGYDVYRCDISLGSDLIDMWSNQGSVEGCLLHEYTFWANDPKHVNDATHPGWAHCDAIQLSGGKGNFVGNNIDMHASSKYGDYAVLGAWSPTLSYGGDIMLTTTNYPHQTLVDSNWFAGGECHVQMPAANNPGLSKLTITNNRHKLDMHPYGTSHQIYRWTTISGASASDVHGNVFLDDPSVPTALRGQLIGAPRVSGAQLLWDVSF